MDSWSFVVLGLQLYFCCLAGSSKGHTVDYYERLYPELFKRDHRKLYTSIDHRKYFCNCNMQKGEDSSLPSGSLYTKPQISSLNKAASDSNKTDFRVIELDGSQMDELLKQTNSETKSKRSVQHVYLIVSLGGLLAAVLLTILLVICLVCRRIRRKSTSSCDSTVRLHHHHHHHLSQQSQKEKQQQPHSQPQADNQFHHRSVVVASPLSANDYKLTKLRCCQKGNDEILLPGAYGYKFCFSKQRTETDSGEITKGPDSKVQWNDTLTKMETGGKASQKEVVCADEAPVSDFRSHKISASVHLRRDIEETESIVQSEKTNIFTSSCYHSFDSSEKIKLEEDY